MKKLFCLFMLFQFLANPVYPQPEPLEEKAIVKSQLADIPRPIKDKDLFNPKVFVLEAEKIERILIQAFCEQYGGYTEAVWETTYSRDTYCKKRMKPLGFSRRSIIPHSRHNHKDGNLRVFIFRYPSYSHTTMSFFETGRLVREYDNLTEVEGFLMLPSHNTDSKKKYPIVVLSHDSGGIMDFSLHYVAYLLATRGIATFIPYHYFSRGIHSTGGDQLSKISVESQLDDIFRGLDVIDKYCPEVDTRKTVLCGFSRGGSVVDLMSRQEYETAFIYDRSRVKLRGIAAFFPQIVLHQADLSLTGVPLLYLCGSSDDYTPSQDIINHTRRILSRDPRYNVRCILFEGAHHCFFPPTLEDVELRTKPPVRVVTPQTLTSCAITYNPHNTREGFTPFTPHNTTPFAEPAAKPIPWEHFPDFIAKHAGHTDVHLAANVEVSRQAIIEFLDFVSSSTAEVDI